MIYFTFACKFMTKIYLTLILLYLNIINYAFNLKSKIKQSVKKLSNYKDKYLLR